MKRLDFFYGFLIVQDFYLRRYA